MLVRRSLQSAYRLTNGGSSSSTPARHFAVLSIVRDEGNAVAAAPSSKKKASVDFSAELQRALGGSNQSKTGSVAGERSERRQRSDRGESRNSGGGGGGGGGGGVRRTQQRRSDADRPRRSQPSVLRKRNDNEASRSRAALKYPQEAPRKIAEDIRPQTDWSVQAQASVPYARVPYGNPGVDLESLGAKRDAKAHKPLKTANKALTMSGLPHLVRGPSRAPTPLARPGRSDGEKPVGAIVSGGGEGQLATATSSVAAEARQERIRLIRENVGGEYQRWTAETILASVARPSSVEGDAAYGVARNYDMQPVHKHFTLNAVHQILARNSTPKMPAKASSKRK